MCVCVGGGGRGGIQITGARAQISCLCFYPSQKYNCLSIVQINNLTQSPSHSAIESQSFRLSLKMFTWSTLTGGRPGGGVKSIFIGATTCSQLPCRLSNSYRHLGRKCCFRNVTRCLPVAAQCIPADLNFHQYLCENLQSQVVSSKLGRFVCTRLRCRSLTEKLHHD